MPKLVSSAPAAIGRTSRPIPRGAAGCQAATDRVWGALRRRDVGLYSNFVSGVEEGRVQDAYPAGVQARLAALKRSYDPHNVFARNVNIRA